MTAPPPRDSHESEQPGEDASEASRTSWSAGILGGIKETVIVIGTALVISLLIKTFLFQMFYIPSESMENTLTEGDRVVVSQLEPGVFDIERGDVVVFKDPGNWLPNSLTQDTSTGFGHAVKSVLTWVGFLPRDSGNHLIKRIIGEPGDRVECCDEQGKLSVNGEALDEPYVAEGMSPSDVQFDITVPDGRYWVMGDNRGRSQDSRFNSDQPGNGTVAFKDIVGRATMIAWPVNRWTWLANYPDTYNSVPDDPAPEDS